MRKSTKKLVMAGVNFREEEKKRLLEIADRRKQTLSQLIKDGAEIMAGFPDEFLAQFKQMVESTKMDMPTVLVQLLVTYFAQDAALAKVYGISNTYQRAFQFDQEGLISGDRLSKKVYNEVLKNAKDLKKKLEENASGQTEYAVLSNADAAQIAIQMGAV